MKKNIFKLLIFILLIAVIFSFFYYDLAKFFNLIYLQSAKNSLLDYYLSNKTSFIFSYFFIYICVTALSLPGAAVMTLLAGFVFGIILGTLIVSFASTIGATLAFLIARFLIGDYIKQKYASHLKTINDGVAKEGGFYLFALRLVPAFPFFLINLLMSLTPIKVLTFFFVSQIGMLPGTIAYVYAGSSLSNIESTSDILSFEIILAFSILGLLPILSKKLLEKLKVYKILSKDNKPKKFDYNIIVIGAGSAGLVASYIASAVKAKVALIEKDKMGGDCLNTGCVPSKALIRSAKILNYANNSEKYGLDKIDVKFNFSKFMQRVHDVIAKVAPHDSIERYTNLGVECFTGNAEILDPYRVKINNKIISAKNIVIATDAKRLVPQL